MKQCPVTLSAPEKTKKQKQEVWRKINSCFLWPVCKKDSRIINVYQTPPTVDIWIENVQQVKHKHFFLTMSQETGHTCSDTIANFSCSVKPMCSCYNSGWNINCCVHQKYVTSSLKSWTSCIFNQKNSTHIIVTITESNQNKKIYKQIAKGNLLILKEIKNKK